MDTIELTDGGLLLYDEAFLPPDLADRYFVELRDQCAWEQKPGIFGHMQPRLTASYGEAGVTYRYSGTENLALPWTSPLLEIKTKIEALSLTLNARAGEEGKLFGSITNIDIERAMREKGVDIERRKIHLPEPIKQLGEFTVPVKLDSEVEASLKITVAAQAE